MRTKLAFEALVLLINVKSNAHVSSFQFSHIQIKSSSHPWKINVPKASSPSSDIGTETVGVRHGHGNGRGHQSQHHPDQKRMKAPFSFHRLAATAAATETEREVTATATVRDATERETATATATATATTAENEIQIVEAQERHLLQNIQKYKDGHHSQSDDGNADVDGKFDIDADADTNVDKPAMEDFVSLIETWLRFPQPKRAEAILDKMEELYTPSGRLYERIINAWAFAGAECIENLNFLDNRDEENDIVDGNDDDDGDDDQDVSMIENEKGDDNANKNDGDQDIGDDVEDNDSAMAVALETVPNKKIFNEDHDVIQQEKAKQKKMLRDEAIFCADKAVDLLNRMEQLCDEVGDDFRPALSTYTSVVNAVLRGSDKNQGTAAFAARREVVERIRDRRDRIYNSVSLEKKHFQISSAKDVFATIKHIEDADQADEVLQRLKLDDKSFPVANRYNFNLIINTLAKTGQAWAAHAAEDILDYMVKNHKKQKQKKITPSIETINGCINAWAHCSSENDSASRAEAVLEKLNALQTSAGLLTEVVPDNISYNTIIKAYANSANGKRAEAVLETMVNLYESTGDDKIRPDLISYSSVLNAYAKAASHDPGAAKKSEEILRKMLKTQENSEGGARIVNSWCFNTVLNAYAIQGAGRRASSILKLMETMAETDESLKPDTFTYNTNLKALANSREKGSVQRARQILENMEHMYEDGDESVKPDAITYNTVILAYANNGGKGAGRIAKSILKRMENGFRDGDVDVKPTSPTYTALIKAFNWEKRSTRHAEVVVASLKKKASLNDGFIQPDTSIYNALLNCWAKSGSRTAPQRAEEIIAEMKSIYSETGNVVSKPNTRTYTTLIDILAKSGKEGAAKRSLEILEGMEHSYEAGDIHAKPNVYTYTAVINCFARSKEKDKAVKAVSVLQRMEEQYRKGNKAARPNAIAYNSVLNACAYTPRDAEAIETAFKIACLVFDEVRTSCHVQPTHVTYGTFLSVCANLMPESEVRDNLVEATFKRCAKNGLVTNMVWRNLKAAASPMLLNELLERANSGLEANWSRNV